MNRNQRFESMMDRVADTIGWTAAHKAKVATRHIPQQRKHDICPVCDGKGYGMDHFTYTSVRCSACNGTGKRHAVA